MEASGPPISRRRPTPVLEAVEAERKVVSDNHTNASPSASVWYTYTRATSGEMRPLAGCDRLSLLPSQKLGSFCDS